MAIGHSNVSRVSRKYSEIKLSDLIDGQLVNHSNFNKDNITTVTIGDRYSSILSPTNILGSVSGISYYTSYIWTNIAILNMTRSNHSATGTAKNSMIHGGITNPNTYVSQTEKYNGKTWSMDSCNIPIYIHNHSATGTSTSCMIQSGEDKYGLIYNNNTWNNTLVKMNTSTRQNHGAVGTSSTAFVIGGSIVGDVLNTCEFFNTVCWINSDAYLNTKKRYISSTGRISSAAIAGGYDGTTYFKTTEFYDGNTWSNGPNMTYQRVYHSANGSSTNFLVHGGFYTNMTEVYNGYVFSSTTTLLTAKREFFNSTASTNTTSSIAIGGTINSTRVTSVESYLENKSKSINGTNITVTCNMVDSINHSNNIEQNIVNRKHSIGISNVVNLSSATTGDPYTISPVSIDTGMTLLTNTNITTVARTGGNANSGIIVGLGTSCEIFNNNTNKSIDLTLSTQIGSRGNGVGNPNNFTIISGREYETYNGNIWSTINTSKSYPLYNMTGTPSSSIISIQIDSAIGSIAVGMNIGYYNGIYDYFIANSNLTASTVNQMAGSINNACYFSNNTNTTYIFNGYVEASGALRSNALGKGALIKINNNFSALPGSAIEALEEYNTITNIWTTKTFSNNSSFVKNGNSNNNRDGFFVNNNRKIFKFMNLNDNIIDSIKDKVLTVATSNPPIEDYNIIDINLNKIDSRTSITRNIIEDPNYEDSFYIKAPYINEFDVDINYQSNGIWETTINYPLTLNNACGTGSVSNSLIIGGFTGSYINTCYTYNTNTWASHTNYPINIREASACGAKGAALVTGGYNGTYQSACYIHNGSSWTATGALPYTLSRHSVVGNSNAAVNMSGYDGSNRGYVILFNGSTWTNKTNMSSTYGGNASGNSNAAIYTGGFATTTNFYTFNGSSISTITNVLLTARSYHNQVGNINNCIISGGECLKGISVNSSFDMNQFDGNTWKVLDNIMNVKRQLAANNNSSTSNNMIVVGGSIDTATYSNSVEIYNREVITVPAKVTVNLPTNKIVDYTDIVPEIKYNDIVTVASWTMGPSLPIALYGGTSIGKIHGSNNIYCYGKNNANQYQNNSYINNGLTWAVNSMNQPDSSSNCAGTGSIFAGIIVGGLAQMTSTRTIVNNVMTSATNFPISIKNHCIVGRQNAAFSAYGQNNNNASLASTYMYNGSTWTATANTPLSDYYKNMVGSLNGAICVGGYNNTSINSNITMYNGNIWYNMGIGIINFYKSSYFGSSYTNATFQTGSTGDDIISNIHTNTMRYNGHVFSMANNTNIGRFESSGVGNSCITGSTNTGFTGTLDSTEIFVNGPLLDQITGDMIDYHGKNLLTIKTTKEVYLPELKRVPNMGKGIWVIKSNSVPVQRTNSSGAFGTTKLFMDFGDLTSTIYNNNSYKTGPNLPAQRNNMLSSAVGTINNGIAFGGTLPTNATNTTIKFNGLTWSSGTNFTTVDKNMCANGTSITGLLIGGNNTTANSIKCYTYSNDTFSARSNLNIALSAVGRLRASAGNSYCTNEIVCIDGQETWNGSTWSVLFKGIIATPADEMVTATGNANSMLLNMGRVTLYWNSDNWSVNSYNINATFASSTVGTSSNAAMIINKVHHEYIADGLFYKNGNNVFTGISNSCALNTEPNIVYDLSSKKYAGIAPSSTNNISITLFFKYLPTFKSATISEISIWVGTNSITLMNKDLTTYKSLFTNISTHDYIINNPIKFENIIGGVKYNYNYGGITKYSTATRMEVPITSEFIDYYSNDHRINNIQIWTTNTNMNIKRANHTATGTATSVMVQGGNDGGGTTFNTTESYNGSVWTTNTSLMNINRAFYSATGTATSCMVQGGYNGGILNTTESYNGSVWTTNTSKLNTVRRDHSATGTATSCMVQGGYNTSYLNNTESYNGSVWTNTSSLLNIARYVHSATGTATSVMVQAGRDGTSYLKTTESYNGSVWTTNSNNMNIAKRYHSATGTATSVMVQGGRDGSDTTLNNTESYNGSVWTTNSSLLNRVRSNHSGTGTATSCMVQSGGSRLGDSTTNTESYDETKFFIS